MQYGINASGKIVQPKYV